MGTWGIFMNICLPIPFVLLVLLCAPAPRKFHRAMLQVVDKTLGVSFFNNQLSLLHFMLVITGVAFLTTLQTTQKLAKDRGFNVGPESDSPLIQAGSMGKKWRSERNFWIAFICFTLWCLLARFFKILLNKARIEDELANVKSGGGGSRNIGNGASSGAAATRPAAPPTAGRPGLAESLKSK
ncbi:TPA: hypothetical protein ACH3X3_012089 [Trebouxia sp. C0006]